MLFLSLLFVTFGLTAYAQDGNCDYGPDTCINGTLAPAFRELYILTLSLLQGTFGEKPTQAM
jgi:hypothetical protein